MNILQIHENRCNKSEKDRKQGLAAEAKPVNAPRQGSALPLTACQISPNVVPTLCLAPQEKKNAELNAIAYFFLQRSDSVKKK